MNRKRARVIEDDGPCGSAPDAPGHGWFEVFRFPQPRSFWNPRETRCLYCGGLPQRRKRKPVLNRRFHARDVDVTRLGRYGPGRQL